MTSRKIYWMPNWEDLKEPIDYIHRKYCSSREYDARHLYAYSVSLGSTILALYLVNEGDKCPLKGVVQYGVPHHIKSNVSFFKNNMHSFYDVVMGFNFYLILKKQFLQIRAFLTDSEYQDCLLKLETNKSSLMDLGEKFIIPYLGFTNLQEYYEYTETAGRLH